MGASGKGARRRGEQAPERLEGALEVAARVAAATRSAGRGVALETEALELVRALGVGVPEHLFVGGSAEAAAVDLERLPGDRLVLKVASPEILHKSDVGGVAVVARERRAVAAAVEAMEERFAGRGAVGYTLNEYVPYDASLGGELLVGMRWTEDFGPVVSFGPGGIYAELLAGSLAPGRGTVILSPGLCSVEGLGAALETSSVAAAVTGRLRGQPARLPMESLKQLLGRLLDFARASMPHLITELEINPLVVTARGPVALDALLRPGRKPAPAPPKRPLDKLDHLLRPRSLAVIGVSGRLNPGRIILRNVLRMGFDRRRLYVVKSGIEEIEGCRCFPDVRSLPEAVDLLVVSIDASQVPALVDEVLEHRAAESLIVVPGGMEERSGGEVHARRLTASLAEARESDWRGPLVNGGNCLGIRSIPGRYDALFIPGHKLPDPEGEASPFALLSQSGAFTAARMSKLHALNPRYAVSVGNQIDLTVGDYLTFLADDPEIALFACYVEGFRPLDGRRWLEAAAEITAGGRPVLLYRAGRTGAGAGAAASHTASIAGDYTVTRELAQAAGVAVADSLADFDDLVRLFCLLRGKQIGGWRLGALSNAGFECVAMADNLGPFRLGDFGAATVRRLSELFGRHRIGSVVEVGNPLDVSPVLDDRAFEEAVRAVLEDPGIDVGVVGCVPLTGALTTLAADGGHGEDVARQGSVARRLAALAAELPKAWVAVIDAGSLYDPMVRLLEAAGIPTFRTADRALRLLATYCGWRLAAPRTEPATAGRASRSGG